MHFEAKRNIQAAPEKIWSILTDTNTLQTKGFGILKIEGQIALGNKIKVWSEASPKRAFPLRISTLHQPELMVWEGGMPFGLFKGVRKYELSATRGGCQFVMREDYSGALLGMIGKSIPDLQPSFEKFCDALKRLSEGGK